MNTLSKTPRRGEIWMVAFDPTMGAEIKKLRPAVVISSDGVGKLPIRLVAPITGWNDGFARNIWHVKIAPTASNGLQKVSAVDALQLRGVDVLRFQRQLGRISATTLEEIVAAIAAIIEYQ